MTAPRYPSLYQINTRVWLTELSKTLGRAARLDDIPDGELDRLAAMGFDWIWLLSVWQTGAAGQRVSRENAQWRQEFKETLPDLREEDIPGSGFAITGYTVHELLGGDAALARLRERLRQRGLKLLLDFVPNHTGLDHPWVESHPDYYVAGSELDLARAPQNYTWIKRKGGDLLLAYGRDPYFAGWPDTLQLNYANPAVQNAMIGELRKIAGQCDGIRCDMAMLVLPDVFERTWGLRAEPFWPAAIRRVREASPDFCFMAEVYWDLEWTLQQQGFDYTYDKRLYDRLRHGEARPVREHFWADMDYQIKLARFLENHDEPRAAAVFPQDMHRAAAVPLPGFRTNLVVLRPIALNLVAAEVLRIVHGMIGAVDKRFVVIAFTRRGDAKAQRDRGFLSVPGDAANVVRGPAADRLGQLGACAEIGLRQQNGEFVPAVAADKILLADQFLEQRADRSENSIAGKVAVRIVHALELIEIGDDQHEGRALPPPLVQQQMELFVESLAVRHAGQGIAAASRRAHDRSAAPAPRRR